ncbi:hypothetical protein BH11MYX3_BH11MYX3_36300 [soil metagenome]
MSLKLAAGLSIVCGGSLPAAAERSIVVELAQPAPFAADELAAAMRMRLPAEGAPVRVRVSATADGVHVDTAPGSRDVALNGLAGTAAARLVALAASDLLLDGLAAAPELVVRASRDQTSRRTIGFVGSVASWDGVLGAGAIDLAIQRDGYVGSLEVGGGSVVGGPVRLLAATVRIDGGVRAGVFELRGGVTLAPILVRTGVGDLTALVGGNASVRIRIPVTVGSRAVIAVGADAFATRTQYVVDGVTVMTTPRIAPWVTAGMEVAL